jgi:TonB family protein
MLSANALPLSATGGRECAPAVFVDGKRVETGTSGSKSLETYIKPEEIASVEVLKGAAAATRFGAEANCGAILITSLKAAEAEGGRAATRAALTRQEKLKTAALSSPGGEGGDRPHFTPFDRRPELLNRAEVIQALERYYPPMLRNAGIGGSPLLWFFIDEEGKVVRTQVKTSSGSQLLDEAAGKVAQLMKFSPALNRNDKVAVWIELPITFRSTEAK